MFTDALKASKYIDMNTLIALVGLAVFILVLEIVNLRKLIVPLTVLGLVGVFVCNFCDFETSQTFYNQMIEVSPSIRMYNGLFIALAIFIVLLSHDFYKDRKQKISDFVSLKIFLLIGGVCMVSFGNLTMFFLGLEILSIALYVLAGSNFTNVKSNEAGMKYFLMGSFASGFILFGIALVYGATVSFDLQTIQTLTVLKNPLWMQLGVVLISVGLLFKVAAFPFHFWAPDVYQGAPALTTATMSTLAKVVAVLSFYKLYIAFQTWFPENFLTFFMIVIIATMFVGNIMALRQENIKRLLAYSGISHAGFMLIALYVSSTSANHLFYYAAAYALAGIAAFSVVLNVCQGKDEELLIHFKGLGKSNPILAIVLSMALLSMAGIPILAGFFGKFFLFSDALSKGYIALVVFGVINSIISVGYYFKIVHLLFSNSSEIQEDKKTMVSNKLYVFVGIVCMGLNILMGVYPEIILRFFSN